MLMSCMAQTGWRQRRRAGRLDQVSAGAAPSRWRPACGGADCHRRVLRRATRSEVACTGSDPMGVQFRPAVVDVSAGDGLAVDRELVRAFDLGKQPPSIVT